MKWGVCWFVGCRFSIGCIGHIIGQHSPMIKPRLTHPLLKIEFVHNESGGQTNNYDLKPRKICLRKKCLHHVYTYLNFDMILYKTRTIFF